MPVHATRIFYTGNSKLPNHTCWVGLNKGTRQNRMPRICLLRRLYAHFVPTPIDSTGRRYDGPPLVMEAPLKAYSLSSWVLNPPTANCVALYLTCWGWCLYMLHNFEYWKFKLPNRTCWVSLSTKGTGEIGCLGYVYCLYAHFVQNIKSK
jgi:hypothetical protein